MSNFIPAGGGDAAPAKVHDETGAAYELDSDDINALVIVDNTVTVPTGLATGFQCTIHNSDASAVTFTTTGLTVNGNDAAGSISADGVVSLIVTASNTILVSGEME